MKQPLVDSAIILNNLEAGVYVVNPDRVIQYWGNAAEKITGWTADDVIGTRCSDGILCHIDKDGHELCSEDYCPLHRAMVTGKSSTAGVMVFAKCKGGGRVPLKVSVAPFYDSEGNMIGGIEVFHDLKEEYDDIRRASQIQKDMFMQLPPSEAGIRFRPYTLSADIIGGDFYAVSKVGEEVYRFLLADVAGHGVSAALFTMYLNLLWKDYVQTAKSPADLATLISNRLHELVGEESHFVAATIGQIDGKQKTITTVGAGCPKPLLFRGNNEVQTIEATGLLLGILEDAQYNEVKTAFDSGDRLLLFTDGATEIFNADKKLLDTDGLLKILTRQNYPKKDMDFPAIANALLEYSDRIRFDDDLTLLEITFE